MESVTVAFELMKLELEAAVEDLNTQGAELFRCSQYEEAKELTDHGGTLRHFCDRVDELATEWNNNFANVGGDEPTEQEQQAARTILSASKSSRTRLLVTFSDGTAIAEKTAAQLHPQHSAKGSDPVRALCNKGKIPDHPNTATSAGHHDGLETQRPHHWQAFAATRPGLAPPDPRSPCAYP